VQNERQPGSMTYEALINLAQQVTDEKSFVAFLTTLREECESSDHDCESRFDNCVEESHWETRSTKNFQLGGILLGSSITQPPLYRLGIAAGQRGHLERRLTRRGDGVHVRTGRHEHRHDRRIPSAGGCGSVLRRPYCTFDRVDERRSPGGVARVDVRARAD
jgi:hypothetical protein